MNLRTCDELWRCRRETSLASAELVLSIQCTAHHRDDKDDRPPLWRCACASGFVTSSVWPLSKAAFRSILNGCGSALDTPTNSEARTRRDPVLKDLVMSPDRRLEASWPRPGLSISWPPSPRFGRFLKKLNPVGSSFWFAEPIDRRLERHESFATSLSTAVSGRPKDMPRIEEIFRF